ncbi:MAG TPA: protein-L-isoaspartate(D-aspartate) O-methyltransferase [Candidatus Limnocylindrales bacterium]|nr:protein-L-isoaspartate(D-aspartate) O-methyltransferase [Candidatus Limnocylindrales bacterium]
MVLTERALDRESMVEHQLRRRGIRDEGLLEAFRTVPREEFVGDAVGEFAYEDTPLPIDEGQTITQPYILAVMVQALDLRPTDRVLEVGAGSGYAAAILASRAERVFAIERKPTLAEAARDRLHRLGYHNVEVRAGDGTVGWPEEAPFDAILVSAGGPDVPRALLEQLAPGGRLVIPVGGPRQQRLLRITRIGDEWRQEDLGSVTFVPLIGEEGWKERGATERSDPRVGTVAWPRQSEQPRLRWSAGSTCPPSSRKRPNPSHPSTTSIWARCSIGSLTPPWSSSARPRMAHPSSTGCGRVSPAS